MYLIGVLIFLAGAFLTLIYKGISLAALWVPAAVWIAVIVPILAVLTGTGSWRIFGRAFKAAALPKAKITESEMGQAATLFRLLSKVTAMCGGIGVLAGLIAAITELSDVEALGHAIAAAFIAPLHALIVVAGVYEPVVFAMKKRQAAGRVRGKRD